MSSSDGEDEQKSGEPAPDHLVSTAVGAGEAVEVSGEGLDQVRLHVDGAPQEPQ